MTVQGTGYRLLSDQEFDLFNKSGLPDPINGEITPVSGSYNVKSLIDLVKSVMIILPLLFICKLSNNIGSIH